MLCKRSTLELSPSTSNTEIPKAMVTNVEGPYWGDKPYHDERSCNGSTSKAIGLQANRKGKVVASCKHHEVKDVLVNKCINPSTHNARQAFGKVKANKSPPHLALPYKCHRKAPSEINVYTDGSWVNPLHQYLGLGGAGVWWPGRDINVSHRLSPGEKDLAYHDQLSHGLMLYTPIGGYTGSSTRTELAAAILAVVANGPVHIGTDSQAFHDKALHVLGRLRKGKANCTKWQLVSDGDLWQQFELAAKAKGFVPYACPKSKNMSSRPRSTMGPTGMLTSVAMIKLILLLTLLPKCMELLL